MGWRGARGAVTSGGAISGRNGGDAIARTCRITWPACAAPTQPERISATASAWRVRRPLTLFLDQLLPAPEIAVTDRAVHVDDALLESLVQLEVQRPVVDRLTDLQAETDPEERQHVGERIHDAVDGLADPIAHGQRLHERQDEIGAWPHAPDAEGLSEVLSTLLDPPVLRRVEQPADAGRAVDQEARDLAAGAAKLPLEQAVDGPRHEADVIEAVRDQDLEGFGHDHVVDLRGRLQR